MSQLTFLHSQKRHPRQRWPEFQEVADCGAAEQYEPRLCLTTPGFTPIELDADVGRISDVAVGDIDGDGTVDALAAFADRSEIAWYANDGEGPKQKHLIANDAIGVVSIAVGDLDGDGDLDVVSSSFGDGKVEWYENDGNGEFANAALIAQLYDFEPDYREELDYYLDTDEGYLADSLALADINGDGYLDIGIGSAWEEAAYLYENDGSGQFLLRQEVSSMGYHVVFADLDADGDSDLVTVSWGSRSIENGTFYFDVLGWHRNVDGSGEFGERVTIASEILADYSSVLVADFDGRHGLDIHAGGSHLFSNLGDGQVWEESTFGTFREGRSIGADLDKDGTWELVGAGFIHERGGGSIAYQSRGPVAAADFDGDQNLDLLSSIWDWRSETSELAWFRSGFGEFESRSLPNSVFSAADLDRDGDLDLLHHGGWLENEALTFVDHAFETEGFRTPTAVDFDLDGDLDLAFLGDFAVWHENTDGRGAFGGRQSLGAGRTLAVGDIDGDEAPDLIQLLQGEIGWRRNSGDLGEFEPFLAITSTLAASEPSTWIDTLKLGDLDADGDVDVLYRSRFNAPESRSSYVAWIESIDSGQSFGQPRIISNAFVTGPATLETSMEMEISTLSFLRQRPFCAKANLLVSANPRLLCTRTPGKEIST